MNEHINKVIILGQCPVCGQEWIIMCSMGQFERLKNGDENVQDIFPELDATDREKLITGWCSTCQDTMFDACEEPEDEGIVWIP